MVLLYWHIGRRISEDLPAENRAEYGAKVVELVSERLTMEYGKGFRRNNVFHMIRFAEVFDDARIVQTLSGLLPWSHFIEIIYLGSHPEDCGPLWRLAARIRPNDPGRGRLETGHRDEDPELHGT